MLGYLIVNYLRVMDPLLMMRRMMIFSRHLRLGFHLIHLMDSIILSMFLYFSLFVSSYYCGFVTRYWIFSSHVYWLFLILRPIDTETELLISLLIFLIYLMIHVKPVILRTCTFSLFHCVVICTILQRNANYMYIIM